MDRRTHWMLRIVLGVSTIAFGFVFLAYNYRPTFLLPDIGPYIPDPQLVIAIASIIVVVTLCYFFWERQFERFSLGAFTLITGLIFGYGFYWSVCLLANFSNIHHLYDLVRIPYEPYPKERGLCTIIGILGWLYFAGGGIIGGIGTMLGFSFGAKGEIHQRGRVLLSYEKAVKIAKKKFPKDAWGIRWGWLTLPHTIATTHFAVIGSTGSGKTILLRCLMQSVLRSVGGGYDERALVYDAKQDSLSIIRGINPDCEIYILNPFDERSVAWDMAKDITAPATAQQIASILIPEHKNASQPFFSDAARHLLSGVLISFIRTAPGKWTFRDVLLTLKSVSRLKRVLSACDETRDLVEQYLREGNTANNVMSTVATRLQRYDFIAAAWHRAEKSISLREWLTSESILILGNDEATRTALDAINQVIFKRLSELLLDQSESESRRTWIFLDELRQAGYLQGLSSLLTKGRSKGACVVLGYQDIEGLREVYGYQLANEIAGQCANKAILRCDSADTARWASMIFGEKEVLESRESTTERTGFSLKYTPGSKSVSEHVVKRDVLLPSEIMAIPPTSPEVGMKGYFITPFVGAYHAWINGPSISDELWPKKQGVLDKKPRKDEEQYLAAWNKEDEQRLFLDEKVIFFPHLPQEVERVDQTNEEDIFVIERDEGDLGNY